MSRRISTITIAPGVTQTVDRRTRTIGIEATPDGRFILTTQREDVTRINGGIVGAPVQAPSVIITHDEIVGNPEFAGVVKSLSSAIDAKDEANEAAIAAAAAALQAEQDAAKD